MSYLQNLKIIILFFTLSLFFSNKVFSQETNPFCGEKFWKDATHLKVDSFIKKGHDMMERCKWTGLPAIYTAFTVMDDIKVRKVLEKHNLNFLIVDNSTTYSKGINLLHAAAAGKIPENIDFLVGKGVGINAREGSDGFTPLHTACTRNNIKIVQSLINNGAKLNALDTEGRSCLYKAVRWKNNQQIEFLLKKGASFNLSQCEKCYSILNLYLSDGFNDESIDPIIIQLLIDYGYSPNEVQKSGEEIYAGRTTLGAFIENERYPRDKRPIIDILLRNGADINQREYRINSWTNKLMTDLKTPIFYAISP